MAESVRGTASEALAWVGVPALAEAATPGPGEGFDVRGFVRRNGTIYMIGGGEQSPIAPLFCAFAEYVHYSAGLIGSTSPAGRLDPPLLMALDEVTQICPVPLNSWVGDSGGKGIMLLAVAHSRAQLEGRWGHHGAATIWDCCGVKMLLGGMTDAKTLDAVGALYGRIPVKDRDDQYRPAPVLPAELLHQLPDGRAIVVRRNMAPVIVRLPKVWRRRDVRKAARRGLTTAPAPVAHEHEQVLAPTVDLPIPGPDLELATATATATTAHEAPMPDPIAQLTSDLAELRALHAALAADVAQLGQKLAHAIDWEQIPGPSAPVWFLEDAGQYDEQLARLRDWIDGVLIPEYGPFVTWLRPCWPGHRPVLWELSVAWAHWRLTYDRPKPSLADAVFFHDRLLPGVCARLEPLMSGCGGNGRCRLDR